MLKGMFGASGETTHGFSDTTAEKFSMTAENLLNEIQASLRAVGKLFSSFETAIAAHAASSEPVWIAGRFPFHAPQFAGSGSLDRINHDRAIVFTTMSGSDGYNHEDNYFRQSKVEMPQIDMSASLYKFPGLRDGQMGVSCHEALFFRRLGAGAHNYKVFGSLYAVGTAYQIKPYAMSV